MTFAEETDAFSRSTSSLQSDLSAPAPPLPSSLPPGTTHFLSHADDSADEASEIIDEDDAGYLIKRRAKSAERDSDFSEMAPLGASPPAHAREERRRRKLGGASTASLDSIPDSGMGTLRQSDADFLRERIASLEKQLKVLSSFSLSLTCSTAEA